LSFHTINLLKTGKDSRATPATPVSQINDELIESFTAFYHAL